MKKLLLLLIATAAFLSACEPIIKMRGRVTETLPVESTDPKQPIEGATVQLYCPVENEKGAWDTHFDPMTTDESGRFADDEIGGPPLDCEFRARRDGYQPASVPLEDVCTRVHRDKYCFETQADITMKPSE
jgi:hypothetical protein